MTDSAEGLDVALATAFSDGYLGLSFGVPGLDAQMGTYFIPGLQVQAGMHARMLLPYSESGIDVRAALTASTDEVATSLRIQYPLTAFKLLSQHNDTAQAALMVGDGWKCPALPEPAAVRKIIAECSATHVRVRATDEQPIPLGPRDLGGVHHFAHHPEDFRQQTVRAAMRAK